jgi:hypothetical protein
VNSHVQYLTSLQGILIAVHQSSAELSASSKGAPLRRGRLAVPMLSLSEPNRENRRGRGSRTESARRSRSAAVSRRTWFRCPTTSSRSRRCWRSSMRFPGALLRFRDPPRPTRISGQIVQKSQALATFSGTAMELVSSGDYRPSDNEAAPSTQLRRAPVRRALRSEPAAHDAEMSVPVLMINLR